MSTIDTLNWRDDYAEIVYGIIDVSGHMKNVPHSMLASHYTKNTAVEIGKRTVVEIEEDTDKYHVIYRWHNTNQTNYYEISEDNVTEVTKEENPEYFL